MPLIIRKPKPVDPHPDDFPGEDAAPKPLPSSSPKINRGRKLPTPYRSVFDVQLVSDGKYVYQKYEGTIVGPFGVARVHGQWTVTLIAVKRKTAEEVPVRSHAGGVALALALSHLPWHEYKVDEHGRRIETAASKKLEADYLKILNSRKEWV